MDNGKILRIACLMTLVFALAVMPASAANGNELAKNIFNAAENEIGEIGENTIIITNLGYPEDTWAYRDAFFEQFFENDLVFTENLVNVQNPAISPLWFAFFDKGSGKCTYIRVEGKDVAYQATERIDFAYLDANQANWTEKMNNKVFEGYEFSIFTIANACVRGIDYELLRCLEIHNHFCPGVLSGYMIAQWMETNYPLEDSQSYTVFGCPTWCKEDVFIKLWDCTPGKHKFWNGELTEEQNEKLGGNPAGIFVVWDSKSNSGKAVVLDYDSSICENDPADEWWASKYKMVLCLLDSSYDEVVSEAACIDINADNFARMKLADVNPYVELGLLNPAKEGTDVLFNNAKEELGLGEEDKFSPENTLIISNIGCPEGTEAYINEFYPTLLEEGLSITENFINVQNSKFSHLWFAVFDKDSGNCVFTIIEDGEITYNSKENIDFDELYKSLAAQAAWNQKIKDKVFKGQEFAIVTIANGWAKGMDSNLVRSVEFHNHFCPGVSSGYIISEYIEEHYPLGDSEKYVVFGCPVWCKEDVFLKLWDATPGIRNYWAKDLTTEEINLIGNNPAGIYVIWNSTSNSGNAVVMGFDFDVVREECGARSDDAGWASKYLMDEWLIDNPKDSRVVYEIASYEIDAEDLTEMKLAGVNPYAVLGVI